MEPKSWHRAQLEPFKSSGDTSRSNTNDPKSARTLLSNTSVKAILEHLVHRQPCSAKPDGCVTKDSIAAEGPFAKEVSLANEGVVASEELVNGE
jgi:hypothetical protein